MKRSLRAVHQTRAGRRTRLGLALALAAIGLAGPLRADEIAWDNTSGDFLWSTPANWSADALPAATDTLLFTDIGAGTINLGGLTQTAAGLILAPDTDTTAYTFSNGTLQLPSITQTAGSATFATAIDSRPAALTADVQADTLSLNGRVQAAGLTKTGEGTLILGGTNNSFSAPLAVADGMLTATTTSAFGNAIVQLAGGDLTLRPPAPGAFACSVELISDAAITASRGTGTGGVVSVASLALGNSTLRISSDAGVEFEAKKLTVGTAARIEASSPVRLGTSYSTTLNGSFAIANTSDVTFGAMFGSGTITCEGPGDVIAGSGSPSTNWIVNAGTLRGAMSGKITLNHGTTALATQNGGAFTLNGGTLRLRKDPSVAISTGAVTVAAESLIDADAVPGIYTSAPSMTLASLSLVGPKLTLTNANDAQLIVSALSVSEPSTLHNAATIPGFSGTAALQVNQATLTKSLTITGNGTASLTKLSGPGDVIMNGTGMVTFLGTNTNSSGNWTGRFVVNSGTVALTGDILRESFATAKQPLVVNDGGTLTLDGIKAESDRFFTRPLNLSGLGNGSAGALSYTNQAKDATIAAPITLNGPTAIYVNRTNPTTTGVYGRLHIGYLHSPTLSGAALTGTGPLVKTGGHDDIGVIWLNVPATYTGGTIINGGGILVNSSGASLVNTGPITVNPTGCLGVGRPAGTNPALHSVNPNSVSLRGGSLLLTADLDPRQFLAPDSTSGGILIGGARLSDYPTYTHNLNFSQLMPGVPGSAWRLGGGEFGAFYHGTISFDTPETLRLEGTGLLSISTGLLAANNIAGLVVAGSGMARPAGQNDYPGDTTVLSGTLSIYGEHSIGTSTAPVVLGDTQPNPSPAALYLNEGGTLSRDITIPAGPNAVRIRGSNAIYSGSISLGRDTSVSGSTVTLAGVVSGPGGLSATDYSTVLLTNHNTYSGPTYVWYSLLDAATTANRTLGNSTSITIDYSGVLRLRSQETYDPAATFTVLQGGAIGIAANLVPPLAPVSKGSFCIDTDGFDAISDLAALGGGSMSLSSTTSGTFAGTSLAPGTGNVYRFGGGGGRLVIVNPVLANTTASLLVSSDASTSRDAGTVVLHGDNAYSGTTQITRGTLEAGDAGRVLGNSASITIASEGRLRLAASSNYVPSAKFTVNGTLGVAGKFIPTIVSASGGTFAIDTDGFDLITSLASLGNGSMFFSSTTQGTLSSPTLAPGSGNVYRFGGGGGRLTVLADLTDAPGMPRSVLVGRSGSDQSVTILAGNNSYTGGTTINNGTLVVSGTIAGPISLGSNATISLLTDHQFPSIACGSSYGSSTIDVGPDALVRVDQVTNVRNKSGDGTLEIGAYSTTAATLFYQRGGRTILRGNMGTQASAMSYASARMAVLVEDGVFDISASQDLSALYASKPNARAIMAPAVEVRVYGDYTSDGLAPSRGTIESLWTDISTGFGQGKSGIDLDPSIDRNIYALGLLLAKDARNEPHALIKALLSGDIDGSGAVDELDAGIMLASFSQPAESATSFTWIEGDLTYDGLLNEFDVGELAWAMDYPFDPAAGLAPAMDALRSMANVPEPATLLLLPLALITLTRRPRS